MIFTFGAEVLAEGVEALFDRLWVKDPADPALRYEAGLIALRLGRAEEGLLW